MRVGVDVRMLKSSGIGKVIENILSRMMKRKKEWDFYLVGKGKEIEELFLCADNVHIIECDCPIYSIKEQFVLLRKIPKKLDLFWSPHYNIPIFYQGRMVVTIHDLAHLALPQFHRSLVKRFYAKTMLSLAVNKASNIICVSNFTKNELIKYINKVEADKISVVYNGVDEKWKNIRKKRSIHSKPYFLYVGNIKPHKNLHRLIKAYKMISGNIKEDLILVGKKEGFITGDNNIADEIKGYENRIIITGYVPDDVLMQYVVNAEALVFPSLYEGFGLPPLEAMAAGIPVKVSRIASLPEICGNYVDYFRPLEIDSIKACLLKVDKKFINRAKEYAGHFTWDDSVNKMIRLFDEDNKL